MSDLAPPALLQSLFHRRLGAIQVFEFPTLGWEQSASTPSDAKVRKELTGLRLSTPAFGSLARWNQGTTRHRSTDTLFLTNGSLLLPIYGEERRHVFTGSSSFLQPYVRASAGLVGGYLQLPKSLGRSGFTAGPQATLSVGVFVSRSVQIEWGYNATGRLRGVNLSSSVFTIGVRL